MGCSKNFVKVFILANTDLSRVAQILIGLCANLLVSESLRGFHSTWKTWKNESTPGKPGNIMEF